MSKRAALWLVAASIVVLVAAMKAPPPASALSASWVHKSGAVTPDDDVLLVYDVVLTEPLIRTEEPSAVLRLISASIDVKVGAVELAGHHHVRGVDPSSAEPVAWIVGDVDLSQAPRFAAQVLGVEHELAAPEYSSEYKITIGPVSGLTWGEAVAADQLEVATSILP